MEGKGGRGNCATGRMLVCKSERVDARRQRRGGPSAWDLNAARGEFGTRFWKSALS